MLLVIENHSCSYLLCVCDLWDAYHGQSPDNDLTKNITLNINTQKIKRR